MLILGLDPGLALTGYGLVKAEAPGVTALAYGVIRTSTQENLAARLKFIYESVTALLTSFSPEVLALEDVFFNKNIRTALAVGQVQGVVLLAAAQREVSVARYTPLELKQAVVGYGRASKQQVQEMVRNLLHLPACPEPDDAADALALALCHFHLSSFRKLLTTGER